jgi:hypothetical protein
MWVVCSSEIIKGGKSYYFRCSADGHHTLAYYGDYVPKKIMIILQGLSSAFNIGINQLNLLAVKVKKAAY